MCQIFVTYPGYTCIQVSKFGFPWSHMQGRAPAVTTCEQEKAMPALSMWLPANLQSVSLDKGNSVCLPVCAFSTESLNSWSALCWTTFLGWKEKMLNSQQLFLMMFVPPWLPFLAGQDSGGFISVLESQMLYLKVIGGKFSLLQTQSLEVWRKKFLD